MNTLASLFSPYSLIEIFIFYTFSQAKKEERRAFKRFDSSINNAIKAAKFEDRIESLAAKNKSGAESIANKKNNLYRIESRKLSEKAIITA